MKHMSLFGQLEGRDVTLFTLRNSNGMEVKLTDYGGIVQSIKAPDRLGRLGEVLLGYDDLAGYVDDPHYMGALCGRYANRIAAGHFSIGDEAYQLDCNLPPHHLHGGADGFHKRLWQSKAVWRDGAQGLMLTLDSPDGDGGYPGDVHVEVVFLLSADNALHIESSATTTKTTPLSLTHHGYFNLSGEADVLAHRLTLAADHLTPVDKTMIPKGTLHPVDKTPFDFRTPKLIGDELLQRDQQLAYGSGYDHNFVLTMDPGALRFVARLEAPASGRVMEVHTTKPGLQLYTGNHIGGTVGRGGVVYDEYGGVCLESQHFPDAPNQPAFPNALLAPGERYRHTTIYRFAIMPDLR